MKANHIKYLLVLGTGALIASCSSDFRSSPATNVVSGDRQNEILLEKPEMSRLHHRSLYDYLQRVIPI